MDDVYHPFEANEQRGNRGPFAILARNLLPKPFNLWCTFYEACNITNSIVVAKTRFWFYDGLLVACLGAGRAWHTPAFGSIVQNGKFSAPMPALVYDIKFDLPTLG